MGTVSQQYLRNFERLIWGIRLRPVNPDKVFYFMSRIKDLTGKLYTRLTVIELSGRDNKNRAVWKCKCSCGVIKNIAGTHLVSGNTKSCGCLHKDVTTTHGGTYTRLYTIWTSMLGRCRNTKRKNYGEKGIKVCDEWINSFYEFEKWSLENGYAANLTLDRKQNDKNYEPENCRWITQKEQLYNTKRNILVDIDGEKLNTHQILQKYKVNRSAVYHILRKKLSTEETAKIIKSRHEGIRR